MEKSNGSPSFYVSALKESGNPKSLVLLAGPFNTHEEALDLVGSAAQVAEGLEQRAFWWEYGTVKMQTGDHKGVLNNHLADVIAAKAELREKASRFDYSGIEAYQAECGGFRIRYGKNELQDILFPPLNSALEHLPMRYEVVVADNHLKERFVVGVRLVGDEEKAFVPSHNLDKLCELAKEAWKSNAPEGVTDSVFHQLHERELIKFGEQGECLMNALGSVGVQRYGVEDQEGQSTGAVIVECRTRSGIALDLYIKDGECAMGFRGQLLQKGDTLESLEMCHRGSEERVMEL